jgi:site-specific recombinase XerC
VFFTVIAKDPIEVRPKDVMSFVTAQRRPKAGAENVVRIADGSAGLAAATIKRRLAAVSCFYGYLITRDDVAVTTNPVPRGIATRRSRSQGGRGLPLVRGVRRLPRILDPVEIDALMGALRTERDRAMTQAMVLGGLRRCEVLGLHLDDLRLGEWRVLIIAADRFRCPDSTRSSGLPVRGRVSATAPATSCATPASPVCARPAWP